MKKNIIRTKILNACMYTASVFVVAFFVFFEVSVGSAFASTKASDDTSRAPRCTLTASAKSMKSGDTVKLTWENVRTNDIVLKDVTHHTTIIDTKKTSTIDEDSGSVQVSPTQTTEYTLTALKEGSKKSECSVVVSVVTLTSHRTQDIFPLASLPYTGFEAGKTLTAIFYALMVMWGVVVAYVLVLKKKSTNDTHHTHSPEVKENHVHTETVSQDMHNSVPHNIPTHHEGEDHQITEIAHGDDISFLEEYAHTQYALISSEALRFIQGQGGTPDEQMATLNRVIASAKQVYPKENDWIVINKERLLEILA